MVAQHEQQHDETMLATHQLRKGAPVLTAAPPGPPPADALRLPAEVLVPGGPFTMGTSAEPWALDNERPAHTVSRAGLLPRHHTGDQRCLPGVHRRRRVRRTSAGGARRAGRTGSGRAWRRRCSGAARASGWVRRRFGVTEPVPPAEPVMHVCFYEAQAYARVGGPPPAHRGGMGEGGPASTRPPAGPARFPWGDGDPTPDLANLGQRHLQPAAVGSYPAGAAPSGARQLIGDVWEWTSSDFLPYPGFAAWPYREYSEVFFGPEYKVLRGGSFAVGPVACRGTFRNWDYPIRRQIFAGFRTARDARPRPRRTPGSRRVTGADVPPPGLPGPARHAGRGAQRPAVRAGPAGLGAAPATARHDERGRLRGRLVRRR